MQEAGGAPSWVRVQAYGLIYYTCQFTSYHSASERAFNTRQSCTETPLFMAAGREIEISSTRGKATSKGHVKKDVRSHHSCPLGGSPWPGLPERVACQTLQEAC